MNGHARVAIVAALVGVGVILLATGSAEAGQSSVKQAPAIEQGVPFRYDAGDRRDPFMPLVRDGRLVAIGPGMRLGQSTPVLYGILWDPAGRSIALINDAEVKAGDRIGDYEVKEIQHDAVVLDNGGEPVVLTITFDAPPHPSSDTTMGGEQR